MRRYLLLSLLLAGVLLSACGPCSDAPTKRAGRFVYLCHIPS